ncbi:MAG: hypothetical protein APF77_06320 [Clostridia bacterium BRH_c25]|nr:MAG: hypothetical protein APF77_06320 [Clostridia bacterium BRH_c25]
MLSGGFFIARAWREEYKGGIYHVIAKGNNKEYIFKESVDKGYFIKQLKEYSKIMGYTVYGYVLMGNHYHLIIQTKDKKLQEIMHQINNKYSKYFNGKYNRVGHVFQGRYKAVLVQDERYILKLLRYIHQNPVRAGMCNRVSEYKWSSDIFYRKYINSFVDILVILEILDKNETQAVKKYMEFMAVEEQDNYSKPNAIGEEAYCIMCESRKRVKQRKGLDEILIETGVSLDDYQKIKSASRKRALTEYKLK